MGFYSNDINSTVASICMPEYFTCASSIDRGKPSSMTAIHGEKSKLDEIDSHKIAKLIRGGMLPKRAKRGRNLPKQQTNGEVVRPETLVGRESVSSRAAIRSTSILSGAGASGYLAG